MEFSHIPVLLQPCLDGLNIDPAGIYLDGTAGGAGHSREIAKRLTTGRLISLDQDPDAVAVATERLKGLPAQVVQVNFREAARVLAELGIPAVNGALLDLGVSSHQLDDAARGFSYHADAPLDMRMSQQGPTAADLVNTLDREELTRILRDYGEEPYAWQIAGRIVSARAEKPITTTMQLAEIVASAVPPAERRKAKNPARRTFQAIRIAVNSELDALNEASVVAASISARQTDCGAPQSAAWVQNSSVRQSACREWVFIIPPASLTSLPTWPTSSPCSNPAEAAISSVSPMKLEVLTTGIAAKAG